MEYLHRRAEIFLQELLDLVGVRFHLTAIQQEGRLGPWSQVLQDVGLPRWMEINEVGNRYPGKEIKG